jgi:predicted N-acetyltransferase YhbS
VIEVEFRAAVPSDFGPIRELLAASGWAVRVADADRFRAMMENADRKMVATYGGRVVGFARALCYGVSNGYIGTVAVAEDKRNCGIGRGLVTRLMGDDPSITWVLRAGRGSEAFWHKLGFQPSAVAMERTRTS